MARQWVEKTSKLIKVNGHELPCPAPGFEIVRSVVVDSGRNANGTVVGQVIGRPLWKLNNLQWNGLSAKAWGEIKDLFDKFYVTVEFTGDDVDSDGKNKRHKITMYPSDMTGQPVFVNNLQYDGFRTCKFNLIDCGKPDEDK